MVYGSFEDLKDPVMLILEDQIYVLVLVLVLASVVLVLVLVGLILVLVGLVLVLAYPVLVNITESTYHLPLM